MVINGARAPLAMPDDNYGRLCLELKFFMAAATSLPNRPEHLAADQQAKADAFVAAMDVMENAQNVMRQCTKQLADRVKALSDKLRWMRNVLPSLTPGDDSILIPFGLDAKVPHAYEELKNYADAADAYWQTVSGEALYDPYADKIDELADLIDDFEDKRMEQVALNNAYAAAQNAKDIARAEHHTIERAIFNHYVAFYPDQQDMYWDVTPWGRATSEQTPVYPVFPEPPETFTAEDKGGGMTEVVYGYVDGATHGLLERRKAGSAEPWIEVSDHLPMDKDNMLPYRELHVPPGEWEYRFTPMNGDEHGTSVSATVVVE